MRRAAWSALGAAALLAAGTVRAQEMVLEPSAVQRCLTPDHATRGVPDYPFDALKIHRGGEVTVELQFDRPDGAPSVEVVSRSDDDTKDFVDAVKRHVRDFRVPCISNAGAPVQLRQTYVFRPRSPTMASEPQDPLQVKRAKMLACMVHGSGRKHPVYPIAARQQGVTGRVLATLRFSAPDIPADVEVHARPGARLLARQVSRWVVGLRLPCFEGDPLEASITYVFSLGDDPMYGFTSALELPQLLPAIRNIRQQRVAFDFEQMGCPFRVSMQYRQPHLPNGVRTFDEAAPSRAVFLQWLRDAVLDLPEKSLDAVYGDAAIIDVPCIKLDLNPTETRP